MMRKIRIKPIFPFENLAKQKNKKMEVDKADPWVIVKGIIMCTDNKQRRSDCREKEQSTSLDGINQENSITYSGVDLSNKELML